MESHTRLRFAFGKGHPIALLLIAAGARGSNVPSLIPHAWHVLLLNQGQQIASLTIWRKGCRASDPL